MLLARHYSADWHPTSESLRRSAGRFGLAACATALILAPSAASFAASAAPADPSGLWSTKNDESIIRIGPCVAANTAGAPATPGTPVTYCGTVVWLKEPLEKGVPKVDDLNPDLAKRGKPIIGMEVFSGFAVEKDHWKGKAYNSDDGKTWEVTFKILPDPAKGDKLELTGCLVWPLCKSETFSKAQTVPGGDPTLPAAAAAATPRNAPAKTPAAAQQPSHSH